MKIDRNTAKEISEEVSDFINSLKDKYGIVVDRPTARFDESSINLSFKCVIHPDHRDSGSLTPEERRYDEESRLLNLPPRGSIFKDEYGEEFQIKQWIPRGRKYKILCEMLSNNKRYKFTPDSILEKNL